MSGVAEMKMRPHFAQADATRLPLADASVDMVFTSPPYGPQRTYGIRAQRGPFAWVDWMLAVLKEATRVCRGLVLVNCAGWTKKRRYQPGPEGLLWEWFKLGGVAWRPAYWHRVGIAGSGGPQWLRADVEYVLCFKGNTDWLGWSNNTANGHPPKYAPGGEMSNRLGDGRRVNQWGHSFATGGTGGTLDNVTCQKPRPSHRLVQFNGRDVMRTHTKREPDGTMRTQGYNAPFLANPGNLVKGITVGGGHLGHPLAHKNEAPFPEKLAEWFIKSWCKPGGIVLDCFSGSGTTANVAARLGRRGIGFDLRMNQCQLGRERFLTPYTPKAKRPKREKVLHSELLFDSAAPHTIDRVAEYAGKGKGEQ